MAATPEPRSEPGWQWQVPDGAWTDELYESLPEDGNRYEVINGRLVMSPSPEEPHQWASSILHWKWMAWAMENRCGRVYAAPFDVALLASSPKHSYLKPDLIYVSNERSGVLTRKSIVGAPDLIVEILSPSTRSRDLREKFEAYQKHGVTHYWVVDPDERYLLAFRLVGTMYCQIGRFQENDGFEPEGFPGLRIDLAEMWSG